MLEKLSKMRSFSQAVFFVAVGFVAVGCRHAPVYEMPLTPALAPHAVLIPDGDQVAPIEVDSPTSLDDLLTLAMNRHPELRAARARVEAAAGAMLQAGLYPNP